MIWKLTHESGGKKECSESYFLHLQNAVLAYQCLARIQTQQQVLVGNFHIFSALDASKKQNKIQKPWVDREEPKHCQSWVLGVLRNNSKVIWGSRSVSFLKTTSAHHPIPAVHHWRQAHFPSQPENDDKGHGHYSYRGLSEILFSYYSSKKALAGINMGWGVSQLDFISRHNFSFLSVTHWNTVDMHLFPEHVLSEKYYIWKSDLLMKPANLRLMRNWLPLTYPPNI